MFSDFKKEPAVKQRDDALEMSSTQTDRPSRTISAPKYLFSNRKTAVCGDNFIARIRIRLLRYLWLKKHCNFPPRTCFRPRRRDGNHTDQVIPDKPINERSVEFPLSTYGVLAIADWRVVTNY